MTTDPANSSPPDGDDHPATEPLPPPAPSRNRPGPPGALRSTQFLRPAPALRRIPETLGPYRIVESVDSGAFGHVFIGERENPKQRVAVKLLREDLEVDAEMFRRFEVEREALATLNHSGIAKLFDAGLHVDGRPYYAMEYIDGDPITEYCDKNCYSIEKRIRLFLKVCDAIGHAHEESVVHRDLKPAHMIVVEQDGEPWPKVIDYGLAKTTKEGVTLQWTPMGTPEYMAPEQLIEPEGSARGGEVDARPDLYALGVVLYELIVGARPLHFERRDNFAAIQRVLSMQQPVSPSRRIADYTESEYAEWARARGVAGAHRPQMIDSDLDQIVLHALEKDPDLRCPTAGRLSELLGAFLDERPIDITPPSRSYLLRKFIRRNRGLVFVASLLFVALSVAAVGAGFGVWESSVRESVLRLQDEQDSVDHFIAVLSLDRDALRDQPEPMVSDPGHPDYLEFWQGLASRFAETRRASGELAERLANVEGGLFTADLDRLRLSVQRLDAAEAGRELGLAELERRIAWSRAVTARTVSGPEAQERWSAALSVIHDAQRCPHYIGMPPLSPQLGLLPLRRDPETKLYEFWLVQSGDEPVVATEGASHWDVRPETGVVLVLLPGGRFRMGSSVIAPRQLLGELPKSASIRFPGGEPFVWSDLQRWEQAVVSAPRASEIDVGVLIDGVWQSRVIELPADGDHNPFAPGAEQPVHSVTLAPFFAAKYETTGAQWERWAQWSSESAYAQGWYEKESSRDLRVTPVRNVSYAQAETFARLVGCALPTEAQWEYLARAGTTRTWYFGDGPTDLAQHANFADLSASPTFPKAVEISRDLGCVVPDGYNLDAPVGSFLANAFGLHDVYGNAWELTDGCARWQGESVPTIDEGFEIHRAGDGAPNPELLRASGVRNQCVLRGGGFGNEASWCRSAKRNEFRRDQIDYDTGFRLVRPVR